MTKPTEKWVDDSRVVIHFCPPRGRDGQRVTPGSETLSAISEMVKATPEAGAREVGDKQ